MTAFVTFACIFASSIVAPAHRHFEQQYGVSTILAVFPTSFFAIGLSLGTVCGAAGSMFVGRKLVLIISMPLSAVFTVACAFVGPFPGLVICRFLAGVFASPGVTVGSAVVSDVWSPEQRALPLLVFSTMMFLGLALGPLVGAFVIHFESWCWTQYVIVFTFAACVVPILAMRETSRRRITRRQHHEPISTVLSGEALKAALFAPLRMISTEPTVLLCGAHSGLVFATLYATFVVFPEVFAQAYGASITSQGLAFGGMLVGVATGLIVLIVNDLLVYRPRVGKWKSQTVMESEKDTATQCRTRSNSRISLQLSRTSKRLSTLSLTSRNTHSRPPSRMSWGVFGVNADADEPAQDLEKNINLAVAAADYLNSLPQNAGKRILPERILLILNKNSTFSDICIQLEAYGLQFPTADLAQALANGFSTASANNASEGVDASELAHARDIPRSSGTVALDWPLISRPATASPIPNAPSPVHLPSATAASSRTLLTTRPMSSQLDLVTPPSTTPPAEWHLLMALPGSVLTAGSLFMFGWTVKLWLPWIVPIIAMGIFGCGALLVFASLTQYIMACHGEKDSAAATAGVTVLQFLLGATGPLFAIPMYRTLGTAWATSTLGFITAAFGLVPWILIVFGPKLRKKRHRSRN